MAHTHVLCVYKASFENVFVAKSHPVKIKKALSIIKTKTRKEDVVGLRSQGSLLAYKANFNIFNAKASNFGGLCCLYEWTNVDKNRTQNRTQILKQFERT